MSRPPGARSPPPAPAGIVSLLSRLAASKPLALALTRLPSWLPPQQVPAWGRGRRQRRCTERFLLFLCHWSEDVASAGGNTCCTLFLPASPPDAHPWLCAQPHTAPMLHTPHTHTHNVWTHAACACLACRTGARWSSTACWDRCLGSAAPLTSPPWARPPAASQTWRSSALRGQVGGGGMGLPPCLFCSGLALARSLYPPALPGSLPCCCSCGGACRGHLLGAETPLALLQ